MFSSTSSSECKNNEYENGYNRYYGNAYHTNPFHTTMGHPLVYYAQMPQPVKHRSRERQRGSPNCFVKAFRWYTEEHVRNKNVSPTKPDNLSGFAAWLDTKYDQFLQESQIDWGMYHLKLKQTSVIEAERIANNDNCEPCGPTCTTKRFRVKSPWRKKRRTRSNETKDVQQRSDESFKYIMQPKDLSRPASECCHPPSNVTIASSKKPSARSQSCSNTKCKESIDVPQVQEGIGPKESSCQNTNSLDEKKTKDAVKQLAENKTAPKDFGCQYCEQKIMLNAITQYDVKDSAVTLKSEHVDVSDGKPLTKNAPVFKAYENISTRNECDCESNNTITRPPANIAAHESASKVPRRNTSSRSNKNVYCQCPETKVVYTDAQTQYAIQNRAADFHNISCECSVKEYTQNYPPPVQSTSKTTSQCPCEQTVKDELLETKKKSLAVKFSQNTAQTSDHSIRLDKTYVHEYPLFMKITCADKLTDENLK